MGKQIVVCMDGTWNDPTERTNVYKIFQMLPGNETRVERNDTIRTHLRKQGQDSIGFYLEGVGAKGRRQGPLGGGFGIGTHSRIIDAYLLVSGAYNPGDKIWIFGFSRGAWSARSLAAFISGMGLVEKSTIPNAAAKDAEYAWTQLKLGKGLTGDEYWKGKDIQPIKLVGVWDTVGALGIPFFNGVKVFDKLESLLFDFADLNLSPRVEHGRQALAIDESRVDFTPTHWNPRSGIVEVWFPGVHGDVGGGYTSTGLSDGGLRWMVDEVNALDAGLALSTHELGSMFRPNPLEDRHDEAQEVVWKLRPRKPREISGNALLSSSVFERLQGRQDYRPLALQHISNCQSYFKNIQLPVAEKIQPSHESLPVIRLERGEECECQVFALKWWNATGVRVKKGEAYRVIADGVWTDKSPPAVDGKGYPSTGLALKLFERSRRCQEADWFTLIAAVHAKMDLEIKNPMSSNFFTGEIESIVRQVGRIDEESQLKATGVAGELSVERDGYLYFFANDSAFAYGNNSGFLDVSVRRVL